MNKLAYILELIWLGLAVFCIGVGIYATINTGFQTSYMFFVLSALAIIMYFIRRRRRLNMEK
jgi:membrane protein implicated in regulation of membrane protease activity